MSSTPPELVGSKAVCQRLNIDRATLWRWIHNDQPKITPYLKMPGRNGPYLFDAAHVDALVAEQEAA